MSSDKPKDTDPAHWIPEGELKCVWMTAGLITYKLCDYEFDCERCPFDAVMRRSSASPPRADSAGPGPSPPGDQRGPGSDLKGKEPPTQNGAEFQVVSMGELPEEPKATDVEKILVSLLRFRLKMPLYYHRGHTWVERASGDDTRMGIDDFTAKLISRAKTTILPSAGTRLEQGHVCSWIATDYGTLPIVAPLSGMVLEVNPRLAQAAGLCNIDPYGEGWLMKIATDDWQKDAKNLLSKEAALVWLQNDVRKLRDRLEAGLERGTRDLGPTLPDGGVRLADLKEMIGSRKYLEIVRSFLA